MLLLKLARQAVAVNRYLLGNNLDHKAAAAVDFVDANVMYA